VSPFCLSHTRDLRCSHTLMEGVQKASSSLTRKEVAVRISMERGVFCKPAVRDRTRCVCRGVPRSRPSPFPLALLHPSPPPCRHRGNGPTIPCSIAVPRSHCPHQGVRGSGMRVELHPVFSLHLYLHQFHNVDLPSRGYYQVRLLLHIKFDVDSSFCEAFE